MLVNFHPRRITKKAILLINRWTMICNGHIFFLLFQKMSIFFIKYGINIFKFFVFENLVTFYWEVFADANAIYFIMFWCILNEKYEFEVLKPNFWENTFACFFYYKRELNIYLFKKMPGVGSIAMISVRTSILTS